MVSLDQIYLRQSASSKNDAIFLAYSKMRDHDLVEEGYQHSMIAREEETSTYLKSGIAIPHGRKREVGMVKKTGIIVLQFARPLKWNTYKARIVVGIAANGDEHIAVLERLTHIILDPSLAKKLAKTKNPQDFLDALLPQSD